MSAIFYQIFIFHHMIALQKLWKVFFISSKNLTKSRITRSFIFYLFIYFLNNTLFTKNNISLEIHPASSGYLNLKTSFHSRHIQLFVYLSSFFSPLSHCFRGWFKKNLKVYDVTNFLNYNLTTDYIWSIEKEIRSDVETLSNDRVLNTEHFYGKIMQMCSKS